MKMGTTFISIKLPRGQWEYSPTDRIGPEGGFGLVYAGRKQGGGSVAIKKLKITANKAAHRELDIAEELIAKEFEHVIPILDAGQDAESESYYIVMERAQKSLDDVIEGGDSVDDETAIGILLDIGRGLSEVSTVVHRDLKPGNVLFHNDNWKVSDFGIARFVERATSTRTLKEYLSPQYAAPEQWQLQRATNATDIYALGCIGYALLTSKPPFPGPDLEDYQDQHLHGDPPELAKQNPRLYSLLRMMLRKNSDTRPNIERVIQILSQISGTLNGEAQGAGFNALSKAGAEVSQHQAELESKKLDYEQKKLKRDQLAKDAQKLLSEILEYLAAKASEATPAAEVMKLGHIVLGYANLEVSPISYGGAIPVHAFPESGWDVVAGACVLLDQQSSNHYRWGASLWYMKKHPDLDYRWWEVTYFGNALFHVQKEFEPHEIVNFEEADIASSTRVTGPYQVAWGPKTIDDEDLDDFCERWMKLLAEAAEGRLRRPSNLPLARDFYH